MKRNPYKTGSLDAALWTATHAAEKLQADAAIFAQADAIDAEARRVERMAELLVQCREALSKSIGFVPTGYGIERQCWEALAALDEFEKGTR